MDDTQQSRVSDAAATRKRRSSILKSQRPPRAPFSELEFNVATPDTTKSRRVSFSRRNGVAEFATNEATTTWKNFYEEHNRSLESSGNDSGAKPRPSVGHIGKRIFDEQFQEVDASHFIQDGHPCTSEISINNIQYVEDATDKNIEPPNKKYDMSMFTDHSNVFGNDMVLTANGEMTDGISLNFSAPVKINDDLEAMEKDLENQFQAGTAGVVGPAFANKNVSEYIEFDLNTTHVAVKDQSDMSITDTIHSPKVQAIAATVDKNSIKKDWIADKENIAVNPYITPTETDNFAINEDENKVLVFDGKRLTLQSEKQNETQINNTTISDMPKQRKNIVLNVNDDLPNFVDDPFASMSHKSFVFGSDLSINKSAVENVDIYNKTVNNADMEISMTQCVSGLNQIDAKNSYGGNISMTEALPNVIIDDNTDDRRKTVVYEDCDGNISITQAVSKNILLTDSTKTIKKQTIVFETNSGDISVTQIVLDDHEKETFRYNIDELDNEITGEGNKESIDDINKQDKRKTIVYTVDDGNISMTQAIPNIIIPNDKTDKRKTIVFDDNDAEISMTQAIPTNILTKGSNEKRRTIIFAKDADISVTQAIPANIISGEIEKGHVVSDDIDMSITKAIHTNEYKTTEKRKTILFDWNNADISTTQAIPNIIMQENAIKNSDNNAISPNVDKPTEKRKTILFDMSNADISMTQAIPNIIMQEIGNSLINAIPSNEDKPTEKRKTIIFDTTNADISMTQTIPNVIMQEIGNSLINAIPSNEDKPTEKRKTIIFDTTNADISMTQTIPNVIMQEIGNSLINAIPSNEDKPTEKRKTIIFDTTNADISMTQTIPNVIMQEIGNSLINAIPSNEDKPTEKRKTIVFDTTNADISMTQAIPNVIMQEIGNSLINAISSNEDKRKTIVFDETNADISMTQSNEIMQDNADNNAITFSEIKPVEKRKTILFDKTDADISTTQPIPNVIVQDNKHTENADNKVILPNEQTKRNTILFDWNTVEMSMTKTPNIILQGNHYNTINNDISMNQSKPDKRKSNIRPIPDVAPDNVLTDVKEEISMNSSTGGPKVKNNKVPNIPSWLRSKASEAKDSLMHLTEIGKDLIANNSLKIDINEFDPESIVQMKQTANESIVRIPKSIIFVEERNIENKIQRMLSQDSDSISTGSSSRNTFSQRPITSCESLSSMSESNYISKAKLLETSEASFQTMSDVFYKTTDVLNSSSNMSSAKDKNEEEDKDKTVIEFEKDIPPTTARPIPSEMLKVQNFLYNKFATDDILQLKSEVSFEQVPNNKVFVYQSEAKQSSSSSNDIDSNKRSDSSTNDLNKTEIVDKNKEANDSKPANKSIKLLTNLLDMSNASLEVNRLDKIVSVDINSAESPAKSSAVNSNDDLFFVTPDDEVVTQTDTANLLSTDISRSFRSAEDEDSMIGLKVNLDLLKKLAKESTFNKEVKTLEWQPTNDIKTIESIPNKLIDQTVEEIMEINKEKSYKDADSTKELLDMLSEFTDKEEREDPVEMKSSSHVHFDLTKRQSIVLSREDFINNFSMAKAVLETTDVDNSVDTHSICIPTEDKGTDTKASVVVSTDVVKILKFDEASFTDTEDNDTQMSPLRKRMYSNESQRLSKNNVIPDYYNDAMDDIKELMNDLVKPNADSMPFDTLVSKNEGNSPSMNSIEVQANLFTSSQVDLTSLPDLTDNQQEIIRYVQTKPIEAMDEDTSSGASPIKSIKSKYAERAVTFLKEESSGDSSIQSKVITAVKEEIRESPKPMHNVPVITFDHRNPVNNIRLAPIDKCEVHKYEPIKHVNNENEEKSSTERVIVKTTDEKHKSKSPNKKHMKIKDDQAIITDLDKNVSQQYVVRYETRPYLSESDITIQSTATVGSLDQYTDALVTDLKDTEVNTVIAMKTNTELLESSSSLTLVDSIMSNIADNEVINSKSQHSNKSPLTVIYKQKKKFATESDYGISDLISKKRIHSPNKRGKDESPSKPSSKIQKKTTREVIKTIIGLHNSPIKVYNCNEKPSRDVPTTESAYPSNLHSIPKIKKVGTSITVQQVIAEYNLNSLGQLGMSLINSLRKDLNDSEAKETSSESSSKARCVCNKKSVCTCDSRLNCMRGQGLPMDWQPELLNEMSSKNLVTECDSGVNVFARINNLPFMGTRDCEWESATRDLWTFRLLHGRLRLTVSLGHRSDNTDTLVRADTPIQFIKLDTIKIEKQNAIANLCVRFASEAVRYGISLGCGAVVASGNEDADEILGNETERETERETWCGMSVGLVAGVVRRGAGVSRVALRWGRAMRDARAQLAYRLSAQGQLTLKVANIPLRSVWEVTMRIEMTVDDASEMPWPRAADVTVTPIVADYKVTQEEITKVVANVRRDWGHAPRTIWKVFRYLKKKNRDDLISLDKY